MFLLMLALILLPRAQPFSMPSPPALLAATAATSTRLDFSPSDLPLTSSSTGSSSTVPWSHSALCATPLSDAITKFKGNWQSYIIIPFIAAFVGWFTNWLAVKMIFYPINFKGLPILFSDGTPLGLLCWRGIVPAKTAKMSLAMVDMVTTQLLSVPDVFSRLEPSRVSELLAPALSKIAIRDFNIPSVVSIRCMPVYKFVVNRFTVDMQNNIGSLLDVRACVVNQMMQDRSLLGKLFQLCGEAELKFLTNSGLWFGFFLGLIQMVVALFFDNPWTLSIGGGIVGLATNWLALKWIFCPVNPVKIGPWTFQGLFLTRQNEVAKEFSNFFSKKVLTSENMWASILGESGTRTNFVTLLSKRCFGNVAVASKITRALPAELGVLHGYVDEKLKLESILKSSMERMSSAQFERVLHPIFEEDELTLVVAGAVLGFLAGLVQQGIATGKWRVAGGLMGRIKKRWRGLRERKGGGGGGRDVNAN